MSKKVRITSESYQVIGFHGMKYSFGPVFGYLLGTEKAGNVSCFLLLMQGMAA